MACVYKSLLCSQLSRRLGVQNVQKLVISPVNCSCKRYIYMQKEHNILERTDRFRASTIRHINTCSVDRSSETVDTPPKRDGRFEELRGVVNSLDSAERMELLVDLQHLEAEEKKKIAEEKLASWRWRSKFGRPSIHPSKADPTGTFCEIPVDWLQKKVAEQSKPKPPTGAELRQLAFFNALPFIGFGFLDNVIMIVAGDYIDITIGTYLGISTMAAAALGNTISDLAGIGSAWYVESVATRIGIRPPALSPAQFDMGASRWAANLGRSFGVVLGCLLGMFPLLLLSDHAGGRPPTAHHQRHHKDTDAQQ